MGYEIQNLFKYALQYELKSLKGNKCGMVDFYGKFIKFYYCEGILVNHYTCSLKIFRKEQFLKPGLGQNIRISELKMIYQVFLSNMSLLHLFCYEIFHLTYKGKGCSIIKGHQFFNKIRKVGILAIRNTTVIPF